jgi:hypothetical protein
VTDKKRKEPAAGQNPFANDPTVAGPTPPDRVDADRFMWDDGDVVIDSPAPTMNQTNLMREALKQSARGNPDKAPKERTHGS